MPEDKGVEMTLREIPKEEIERIEREMIEDSRRLASDDSVKHPEHYTQGPAEAIKVIEAAVDDFASYCHGNALKYLLRAKHKGGREDIAKAREYLDFLLCDKGSPEEREAIYCQPDGSMSEELKAEKPDYMGKGPTPIEGKGPFNDEY